MRLDSIRSEVKLLVGDSGNNYFTQDAYNRFINDAWVSVYLQGSWIKKTTVTPAVVGQRIYTLTGFSKINNVDYDDRPLEYRTKEWLAAHDVSYDTSPGRPQYWYINADLEWGYDDTDTELNQIAVYPVPDGTDNIRVMGIAQPNDLSSDSSRPDTPIWSHRAIVYEAAARVLESQGEQRNEPAAVAFRLIAKFWIDKLNYIMSDRHSPQKVNTIGRGLYSPKRFRRENRIPGTGIYGI